MDRFIGRDRELSLLCSLLKRVGADRAPIAHQITFVGSIKWRDNHPFATHDLSKLIVHRSKMPGADQSTPLLVASRSGSDVDGPVILSADDLLAAWHRSAAA